MPQLTITATRTADVFSFFLSERPTNPYCMETLASAINNKLQLHGNDVQRYAVYYSLGMDRLYLEYEYNGKLIRVVDVAADATIDDLKKKWPDDAVTIIGEITELNL